MYGASSDNSYSICSNEGNHKNSKGQWIGGEADDEKRPGYTDRNIKSNNRRLNGGDHMLTTITAITTGVEAAAAGEVIKEILD